MSWSPNQGWRLCASEFPGGATLLAPGLHCENWCFLVAGNCRGIELDVSPDSSERRKARIQTPESCSGGAGGTDVDFGPLAAEPEMHGDEKGWS